MFTSTYHKRLSRDLERWMSRGWLSSDGRAAILSDIESRQGPSRLPAIIGILGALLLTTGAMTFVSANWDEMSKLTRLILLISAMWAAFGAAVWFQRSSHDYLLEAMLFLGAGLFGVNIMLIAQIYHIDGHYPDALFLWIAGALIVTLVLESRAALALAFVLMVIWTGTEMFEFDVTVHWPFLPVWIVATVLVVRLNWPAGLHLAILSLAFWVASTLLRLADIWHWPLHQIFGLLALIALGIFLGALSRAERPSLIMDFEPALMRYAMLGFLSSAFCVQLEFRSGEYFELLPGLLMAAALLLAVFAAAAVWWRDILSKVDLAVLIGFALWLALITFVPKHMMLWLHAPILMGFAIWLMGFAQHRAYRIILPMALSAFGIEVLYVYGKTLGSLLDTSLFFLAGGALLIVLAIGLEKLRRVMSPDAGHSSAEQADGEGAS